LGIIYTMGGVFEELGLDPRFRLLYKQSYACKHVHHTMYTTRSAEALLVRRRQPRSLSPHSPHFDVLNTGLDPLQEHARLRPGVAIQLKAALYRYRRTNLDWPVSIQSDVEIPIEPPRLLHYHHPQRQSQFPRHITTQTSLPETPLHPQHNVLRTTPNPTRPQPPPRP
jgi:hypothetical protein